MPQGAESICTLENYEGTFAARHTLPDVVDWWAERRPDAPALIHHNSGQALDWRSLRDSSGELARRLAGRGFRKGDYLVTVLPFTLEHVLLAFACYRLGVVLVPLDLRLPPPEIARCVRLLGARGFVGLSSPPEPVEHSVDLAGGEGLAPFDDWPSAPLPSPPAEDDPALVIFTTGSTGSPKAALLSHRGITCQNLSLGAAFAFREESRILVNLPPSHVGGQTEAMMTALFWGGTAVLLSGFDPVKSLEAIRDHRVSLIGQIPAMFQFEWRQPTYAASDLSSLEVVIYGGQSVARPFLDKAATMAPSLVSGLGLTESSGFCTYTPLDGRPEYLENSLGWAMPVYPMSVRRPMQGGGKAGPEVPPGEIGHVCFRGPQTFLGYAGDREATARTVSSDGWLYTGDLGSLTSGGLRLAGRANWVIKPAGYQVFPGDVEAHFLQLDKIAACGVVGAEHRTLSEAVVAFIEPKPGVEVSVSELRAHARGLASYQRPLHYIIVPPGQLPLNRTAKVDTLRLQQMARDEIKALRDRGRWDS